VHETEALAAVVVDVFGPGAALDVDEYVRHGLLEHDSHQRVQVAWSVSVGEVVGIEARVGVHGDGADVFSVRGILSFTGHPHFLRHLWWVLFVGDFDNVILEGLWHIFGKLSLVPVYLWYPVDHLVHLEQDARLAVEVAEVILLLALFAQHFVGEDTGLVLVAVFSIVAHDHVLAVVSCGLFVWFHKGFERLHPILDVLLLVLLVPDEGRLYVLGAGQGHETHGWVL